jgi:hypothetical protein
MTQNSIGHTKYRIYLTNTINHFEPNLIFSARFSTLWQGGTTLSITTLCVTTFSITALSIMTLSTSIKNATLSITTFSIMTLETNTVSLMLSVVHAECHK